MKICKYSKEHIMENVISRRDFVRYMSILGIMAFYSVPLHAKTTKAIVKYQFTPNKNGDKCATCMHFLPATKECKIVEGPIDPNGWCINYFKTPVVKKT
jgi:hypothetical protein